MLISRIQYKKIPDLPGVYFFKKEKEFLYIGKATSLRDRIKSYFGKDLVDRRGVKILKMVEVSDVIEWKVTDSVLEALMLEASLIKKHNPEANTLGKDNKSYNHIIITKEEHPRVILVREHDLKHNNKLNFEIKYQFGPFPQPSQLKEALKIARRIFPFRGEKDFGQSQNKKRISFLNVELGLSPDFSVVSKQEYQKTIRNLKLFFEGNKKILKRKIEKEMLEKAKKQEFEKAEQLKRQIFALDHIQDIALLKNKKHFNLKRIEAYDIAHMSEKNKVGVMTVLEKGELKTSEYRKFNIRRKDGGDTGALQEVLKRRFFRKDWEFPDLIVADGGISQLNVAKKTLLEKKLKIPIVSVLKDAQHKPKKILGDVDIAEKNEREILLSNAEAHRFAIKFHRQKRNKSFRQ
jgi:excinuclease ABC subunit C